MDLIDRSKFIDDMKKLYSDHDFDSREIHFSLLDLTYNLDCKEYKVDAIPIEWIEQYLHDLVVGKEKHVINVGEILSMSDEEYYLKHLIKRWKQEQEKANDRNM